MKEIGRALYGSFNYALAGPESDKDYKIFLCPNFTDLYNMKKADKNDLSENLDPEHYSVLDVRKFAELIVKGNVNCLEYLFSTELTGHEDFLSWCKKVQKMYSEGYIISTWNNFINSVEGMMKHGIDRCGANRKSISRAYYLYMLAETIVRDNFKLTARTWRNNIWNGAIHQMRFDENSYLPSREEIFNNFDQFKKRTTEEINALRKDFYIQKIEIISDMKDIVMSQI